ncbi:DUF6338 family protein [Streptomyces sp. BA2]|uniref:DUF6338 family protein n=1 Tax=Streptomyces sp. BA2 TaxID=436595 RepID=UPI0013284190|nr:DUF6338 family protein [Streptomyces sp. BA2]MWA08614.1 hypothetical protein [Streptomyces sp. BA2]
MQPPSTIGQLVALVLLLLPGLTYQFLRERWRGPVAGEAQLGERVLRAITASVALNGLYAIVAGPVLVEAWRKAERSGPSALAAEHPRAIGLWALLLFLAVPAAAAAAVSYRERRRARSVYRPVPTAWDYAFGTRADSGRRFVRARLKDGTWVGGWFGTRSYASGYPQEADLYLQVSYCMGADGSFGPRVESTDGIYLRMADLDMVELLNAPERTGNDSTG